MVKEEKELLVRLSIKDMTKEAAIESLEERKFINTLSCYMDFEYDDIFSKLLKELRENDKL